MAKNFIQKIYQFGKRYFGFLALASVLRFLTVLAILWLSVSLADDFFYFSEVTRWGLWFINLTVVGWLFFRLVFLPVKRYLNLHPDGDLSEIARMLGSIFPEIEDDLINAYQLVKRHHEANISDELKEAAVNQIVSRYGEYDFNRAIRFKNLFPEWKWAVATGFILLLMIAFRGNDLWHSTLRLLNPTNDYATMPAYQFFLSPQDTTVVKGDPLKINIRYQGPELAKCFLLVEQNGKEHLTQCQGSGDQFFVQLPNVQKPFYFQVVGEPLIKKGLESFLKSEKYRVRIVTLPFVKILDVMVQPPSYTNLPEQKLERNIGDVQALKGSKIKLRVMSENPLKQAKVIFSTGDTLSLRVEERLANGQFVLKEAASYFIALMDTAGYRNRNPIHYQLSLLEDYNPLVEIVRPGEDLELTLDSQLPIEIETRDDFGISKVRLGYQIVHQPARGDSAWQFVTLPLPSLNQKQLTLHHVLDFNTFPLAFGDLFKYYAVAFDNNVIDGPGKGVSRVYTVRFPSIEEVFQAVDETQQESVDDLEDVAKEAKALKESLKKIERELKQSKKLDWEKKNQLSQDIERQKKLQKKIEQIRKELEKAVKKLEQNDLISEELLQKYMKLQDLFREVLTPELEEALKKLNQALEKSANPKEIQKALTEFRLNQKAFEERIERTMELLKQVQLEQKMEELVKKAEALYKQQQKISEQLKDQQKLDATQKENLMQKQKKQQQLKDRLQFDLQEMQKNPMLAKYPETSKQLDSSLAQISSEQLKEMMENLQQSLQQSAMLQAQNQSNQLGEQFQKMAGNLQRAYQKLLNQSKQRIAQKMQKSLERLLQLSQAQEQLHRKTQQTSQLSEQFNQIIRQQGQLNENLNKAISEIVQLSKETFLIQPQMSQSLQKAARSMNQALQQLGERFKNSAMQSQMQAMAALNQSAGQMMKSQQQLGGSSSGTGFEQFLQQLQKMAGKQGQINGETLNLFSQGNQGKLTLQQQQAMQRLAAQQAALRQAMENLNQKMGERQDVLGRLGQVAQEMDKVVKDLLNKNISRKTIERQQRILSRMLDAQKSIREKEYSKKRKAERAKNYLAHDPKKLGDIYDLELKQLQDAMRNALQQGYNRDYQLLIEAYFKRLLEKYQQQQPTN